MTHATVHVLLYALAAAASPLVLTATFVVIRSDRPRDERDRVPERIPARNDVACIVGLIVGTAFVERIDSHEAVESGLTLLLGLALIGAGLRARQTPVKPEAEGGRGKAILAGLSHVGPAAAFSMAGLLGFGGPKRLVLTLLAMASVSEATIGDVASLSLVAVYVGVATILVSVPVGIVVIAGERAAVILAKGQSWLTTHAAVLRVWLAVGIGIALCVDALVRLLT